MKTIFQLSAHTILVSTFLLTGCDKPTSEPIYEFHSGGDGQIIWRCNRLTGEVTAVRTNLVYAPQAEPGPIAAYELHNSTDTTPILLNKFTGKTWRYYRNKNSLGEVTDEGFVTLNIDVFLPPAPVTPIPVAIPTVPWLNTNAVKIPRTPAQWLNTP